MAFYFNPETRKLEYRVNTGSSTETLTKQKLLIGGGFHVQIGGGFNLIAQPDIEISSFGGFPRPMVLSERTSALHIVVGGVYI